MNTSSQLVTLAQLPLWHGSQVFFTVSIFTLLAVTANTELILIAQGRLAK